MLADFPFIALLRKEYKACFSLTTCWYLTQILFDCFLFQTLYYTNSLLAYTLILKLFFVHSYLWISLENKKNTRFFENENGQWYGSYFIMPMCNLCILWRKIGKSPLRSPSMSTITIFESINIEQIETKSIKYFMKI